MKGMKSGTDVFQCLVAVGAGSLAALLTGTAHGFAAPARAGASMQIDSTGAVDDAYLLTAVTYITALTVLVIAFVALAHLVHRGGLTRSQHASDSFLADILGLPGTTDTGVDALGSDIDLRHSAGPGAPQTVAAATLRCGQPFSGYRAADRSLRLS